MKFVPLIMSFAGLLFATVTCTFTMCHPYKLNSLCEYVGSDGWEKPK
jgi:hypothetical protein